MIKYVDGFGFLVVNFIFLIMGWIRFIKIQIVIVKLDSDRESWKDIYCKTFQNRNDAGRFTYENNKRLC